MDATWHPRGPGAREGLPDAPGVFVLGTMVRSILLVGIAEDRGLRAAVAEAVARGPLSSKARCVRWEACADPRARQAQILDEYRRAHGGYLPPEQPPAAPPLRAVPGAARRPKGAEPDAKASAASLALPVGRSSPRSELVRSRVAG